MILLPPYPATNNDTKSGTGTTGNVILMGYPQLILWFKEDAKEDILPIEGWRTVWSRRVTSTLRHGRISDGGSTHPRWWSRWMFHVFNLSNMIFKWYINFICQEFYGDNTDEWNKKNVMFMVATDSKRDLRRVLTNITNIVFTYKEDAFVNMAKLAGLHHMIITIGMYGWWTPWLRAHQR